MNEFLQDEIELLQEKAKSLGVAGVISNMKPETLKAKIAERESIKPSSLEFEALTDLEVQEEINRLQSEAIRRKSLSIQAGKHKVKITDFEALKVKESTDDAGQTLLESEVADHDTYFVVIDHKNETEYELSGVQVSNNFGLNDFKKNQFKKKMLGGNFTHDDRSYTFLYRLAEVKG